MKQPVTVPKQAVTTKIALILLILGVGVALTACQTTPGAMANSPVNQPQPADQAAQQNNQPANTGYTNMGGRGYPPRGNLSPEQQQEMQQRMQAMTAACSGLNVGDTCSVTQNNTAVNGTCQTFGNQTQVICSIQRQRGNYTGNYTRSPYGGAPQ